MKKYLLPMLLFISACASQTQDGAKHIPSPSGSIVATDSMTIKEDALNGQSFSVTIFANDSSINGTYIVEMAWGYNTANTSIKLPTGGEHFKPLIRKADTPYTFIIGFHFDNDSTFRDYYQVSAQSGQIAAKYIKAYQ